MVCVAIYACSGGKRRSGGQPAQRIMVGSGIYRNPVFQLVQDRLFKQINFQCPLSTKKAVLGGHCPRKERNLWQFQYQCQKDLSGIKTKVALNLTKRQIICFSGAALVGVPLYFLTKGVLGTQGAALIMVGAMLPFFFLAMYEKDGFPAEKILYFMLRQKVLTPGIRPYKSENLYEQLEEREKIRKEVCFLEEKAKGGSGKAKAAEK